MDNSSRSYAVAETLQAVFRLSVLYRYSNLASLTSSASSSAAASQEKSSKERDQVWMNIALNGLQSVKFVKFVKFSTLELWFLFSQVLEIKFTLVV